MVSVVIVEDELNILRYIQKELEGYGIFKVKGAYSDPAEALSEFGDINPDCLFLDVRMSGVNGIELVQKFLKIKKDICIIYTADYSQYRELPYNVEAIDNLVRPILFNDISRSIRRIEKTLLYKASLNCEVGKDHMSR